MEQNNSDAATGHTASGCFFCETAIPLLEKCFPEGTREHFRASRVEFLKGLRTLIDARIAQLSREAEPKGSKIKVE